MDPDPQTEVSSYFFSPIFKTATITLALTACSYNKTDTLLSISSAKFILPDSIYQINKSVSKKKKRTIYLTFDDGPNKGTRKMMHIINQEEVPVTLFIIGEHVYGSKEQSSTFDSLLKSKYFEIANHSYTHAFHNKFVKFYSFPDSVLKDFVRCADSLHLVDNIIRTPGRNIWRTENINSTDIINSKIAADSLQKNGFTEIGWDLEWRYDNQLKLKSNCDEMLKKVDNMFTNGSTKTSNHLVLLAHDQVYEDSNDSTQLHQFIKKLKAKDEYNFETVSKYPGIKN